MYELFWYSQLKASLPTVSSRDKWRGEGEINGVGEKRRKTENGHPFVVPVLHDDEANSGQSCSKSLKTRGPKRNADIFCKVVRQSAERFAARKRSAINASVIEVVDVDRAWFAGI
jgi:hypothetical protein